MKNSKLLFLLLALTLMLGSCSELDNELTETIDEFAFVKVNLPDDIKFVSDNLRISEIEIDEEVFELHAKGVNGETVKGFIKFIIPDVPDEKLLGIEITNNILNKTILDEDFLLEMGIDFISGENGRIQSSCVASCHGTFTDKDGNKIKGRGWCKAQCWAGAVATVAAAVIVAIL